jgi:hypothetical protein
MAVVLLAQRAEDLEGGDHTQTAIEPAAVGYGVEMAAEDEGSVAGAAQGDPVVAGGVVVTLDVVLVGQRGDQALEPGARLQPGGRPGDALRAGLVAGEGAKGFQVGDYTRRFGWDEGTSFVCKTETLV